MAYLVVVVVGYYVSGSRKGVPRANRKMERGAMIGICDFFGLFYNPLMR
jgi:hypothetical protein